MTFSEGATADSWGRPGEPKNRRPRPLFLPAPRIDPEFLPRPGGDHVQMTWPMETPLA